MAGSYKRQIIVTSRSFSYYSSTRLKPYLLHQNNLLLIVTNLDYKKHLTPENLASETIAL